jgi:hypothetical protein
MNQLDELIRSTLDQNAQDAPPAAPVVARVLEHEPRRRYRTPWLATAAVATATAAVVAVGVTQLGGDGNHPSTMGRFTDRELTYAEGSTIHYGDQAIDVAPHEIAALVPTDDGFVFADQDGNVLLTDGEGVEQIGQVGGFSGDNALTADDTGSYVGWVDGEKAVVYDTADRTEVLHETMPVDEVSHRTVSAIDDGRAYVQHRDGIDVWNLEEQTKTTITRSNPDDELGDVANGYHLWQDFFGPSVVSRDPEATRPVFRQVRGAGPETDLSPSGTYAASGRRIIDRRTQDNVTPDVGPRPGLVIQWLDDDRYLADTDNILTTVDPEPHDLLTCSISTGSCEVAVESLRAITYPNGVVSEGTREG